MISAELGNQLESFVEKLVAAGRYNSKSEVLREGVRLIQDRETKLAALDVAVARGLEDVESGRTKPAEEMFARLRTKHQTIAGKSV